MSEEQIREVLVRELCHPDFVDSITINPFPFTGEYFCSTLFRCKLVLKKNAQEQVLIVKTYPVVPPEMKIEIDLSNHFHNECLFYDTFSSELFPNDMDLFPGVHFLNDNMLIFDDLSHDGFKMGPKPEMDIAHFKVALKALGRLHAASLAFKLTNPERFNELASQLKKAHMSFFKLGAQILAFDALKHYQERYSEEINERDLDSIKKEFKTFFETTKNLKQATEPWSVICHGDFNRNNMLFKYDSNNAPVAVKFIDFQTSGRYNPVIDLSFFIYMNSTQKQRDENREEIINAYFTSIETKLKTIPGGEIYNRDSFEREYKLKAFYGVMVSVTFVRTSLADVAEFERDKEFDPEVKESWEVMTRMGGKKADQRIADLIHDTVKNRFWPLEP